jgi:hypothetical protein
VDTADDKDFILEKIRNVVESTGNNNAPGEGAKFTKVL